VEENFNGLRLCPWFFQKIVICICVTNMNIRSYVFVYYICIVYIYVYVYIYIDIYICEYIDTNKLDSILNSVRVCRFLYAQS